MLYKYDTGVLAPKIKIIINQRKVMVHKMTTKKSVKKIAPWRSEEEGFADESTKIIYKKLPNNMVMIVGFKNFMTAKEIKSKYGEDVAKAYVVVSDDSMVMTFESDGSSALKIPLGDGLMSHVHVGDFYSDDEFSKIIASVKKCGNVLHEIVAAFNTDSNVKEIKI